MEKKKEPYRGFASLPREMVQEFGRRGGNARKQQIGTEGFVAIGRQGGAARAAKKKEEEARRQQEKAKDSPKK